MNRVGMRFSAIHRHMHIVAALRHTVNTAKHGSDQYRVEQCDVVPLLCRRGLAPEAAEAEARSTFYVHDPVDEALQTLCPRSGRVVRGDQCDHLVADLSHELSRPGRIGVAPRASHRQRGHDSRRHDADNISPDDHESPGVPTHLAITDGLA